MKYEKIVRNQVLVIGLSVMVMVICVIGSSYALFMQRSESSSTQVIDSGTLTASYEAGSTITTSFVPLSDSDGLLTTGYTFKISNTGSLNMNYDISVYNTGLDNSLEHQYLKISIDGETPVLLSSLEKTSDTASETVENNIHRVLKSGSSIESGSNTTHVVRIWIDEDAPVSIIGKNVSLELKIEGVNAS